MRKNEQTFSELVKLMFRDEKTKPIYFQTKIEMAWRKEMGETIDRNTQDIFLKNRILYIKITSASLKQELSFSKDKILQFANSTINEENYITQIVIV
ncbi:MAG: DciA family protein [Saprospiraceae bacterium]